MSELETIQECYNCFFTQELWYWKHLGYTDTVINTKWFSAKLASFCSDNSISTCLVGWLYSNKCLSKRNRSESSIKVEKANKWIDMKKWSYIKVVWKSCRQAQDSYHTLCGFHLKWKRKYVRIIIKKKNHSLYLNSINLMISNIFLFFFCQVPWNLNTGWNVFCSISDTVSQLNSKLFTHISLDREWKQFQHIISVLKMLILCRVPTNKHKIG